MITKVMLTNRYGNLGHNLEFGVQKKTGVTRIMLHIMMTTRGLAKGFAGGHLSVPERGLDLNMT